MKIIALLLSFFALFPYSAPRAERRELPVLMYHSVCAYHNNDYVLHPDKFESDLVYLLEHGYEPIFLSEAEAFCEGAPLPEKPVVITFDDGCYNNLSVVLPIAKRHNVKCEINVVGAYVEEESEKRSDIYSYLNAKEIAELRESGLFEIGNHSYDMHRKGKRLGVAAKKGESDEAYAEALGADSGRCRDLLEAACGVRTRIFALPYGFYSKSTVRLLGEFGYRWVLSCEEGVNVLERGESGVRKLRRYNRPNRYSTENFFAKCGLV